MRTGLLALAVVVLAPLAAIAADPPIVFQIQPPGQVLGDVRGVVRIVAGEDAVKHLDEGLKEKLGAKGLEGLDLERPILGYALFETKVEEGSLVVMVPVTGEKDFLGLLERVGIPKPKMVEKGLYEYPLGESGKVLIRFEGQYAYIALGKDPGAAVAVKALVPPGKLYDPADKSLAFAKVYYDRMPKEMRAANIEQLKQLKAQLDMLQLPAEASAAARKAVDELLKLANRYADLLQDAQSLTARLVLDGNSGEAAVEIGITGAPGSKLAEAIASRKPSTNKFAGLVAPDTAIGLRLQLPLFAPEIQKAAVIGLETAQKQAQENAPPEAKGLAEEVFKGLIRTVETGEFDLAVALRGPDNKGRYSLVGAVAFEDPSGVEKELRGLNKTVLPPMFQEMVVLDVAKVGKTSIHQIKFGGMLPPEAQKLFGDEASVTLAFAPHGIFFAFSQDAVSTMKSALEKKLVGPSPAFEVAINPSRLGKLVEATGKPIPKSLGNRNELLPAVAVTIGGGNELRLRLGTNLKAFEGFGSLRGLGVQATPVPAPVPK